ncbi:MAG: ATP-binding protein [Deinococcota bacterium]
MTTPPRFVDDTLTTDISSLLPAAFPKKRVYRIVFGLSAVALLFSAIKTLLVSSSSPVVALFMCVPGFAALTLLAILERRGSLPRVVELTVFSVSTVAFFGYFGRSMMLVTPADMSGLQLMARKIDWFIWTPLLYATTSLIFQQRQALRWCAVFYVLNTFIGLISHVLAEQRGVPSNLATLVDFQFASIIVISLTYFVRNTAERLVTHEKTHRRKLEQRYRTLFDHSPVALWEEDLAAVYVDLERLRASGVNLAEHLCDQTELMRLFRLIRLHDVNQEALRYFRKMQRPHVTASETAEATSKSASAILVDTCHKQAHELTEADLASIQAGRMLKGYGYYQWYLGLLSLMDGERYFEGNQRHPVDRYKTHFDVQESSSTSIISWQVLDTIPPLARVLVSRVDLQLLRTAEADLAGERRLLRTLVDALPDVVIAMDTQQRITLANKAAAELVGTPPQTLKNKTYQEVMGTQAAASLERSSAQVLAGTPLLGEADTIKGRHMLTNRVPLVTDKDQISGMVVASRDVTDLQESQRQVRESQALLARAQSLAKLGNWRLNTRTGQLHWSDETFRIVGRDRSEGMPTIDEYYTYLPEEERLRAKNVVQEAIEYGQPYQVDHRVIRPDGTLVHVHSRREAADVAKDGTIYLMGTIQDISDRKVLELELNQRNLELNQAVDEVTAANQARDRFIASISHELKTPLNAISGFAQLLRLEAQNMPQDGSQQPNYQQWSEDIGRILEAAKLLGGIINDMIYIAHGQDGYDSISLNWSEVPLAALVEEACGLMRHIAVQYKVDLHMDIPLNVTTANTESARYPNQDIPLTLRADAYKLKQALLNLLSNAIKYNHPGGHVWLRVSRPSDQYVSIAIEDSGRGIAPEQLEHLFKPFERLGIDETSHIPGHGLGLSLTKTFVEAMGGHIEVQSELSKGSCFEILLPVATPITS